MSMPVISALDFTGENMVDETISKESPMKSFYRDKTIFLTGGTGFLGQLFVEKLLRCKVKEIYLLARPKKNKSSTERIQETFVGALFSKLTSIDPNYMARIKLIEGDTQQADLGISSDNRKILIENVEIVIHSAADVRFDRPLQEICLTNVRGTKALISLVENMKRLVVFGYISTAFSQCYLEKIEEKFYQPPCDPDEMIRICEYFDKNQTDEMNVLTDKILQPWANTYVFSKALSEELVRRVLPKFPTVLIRPSIIISTYEDPIPAWTNNIYGINGLMFGAGLGIIRVSASKADNRNEMVCADFVTNGTLAAIWDKANERYLLTIKNREHIKSVDFLNRRSTDINNIDGSKSIVHITAQDQVTYGDMYDKLIGMFFNNPSNMSLWVPSVTFAGSPMITFICTILYHVIPAIAYDTFFKLTNNKNRLMPLYRKFQEFLNRIPFFSTRIWDFDHNNFKRITESMSEEDEKFFPCNVFKFDLLEYCYSYMMGLRIYIAKDPLETMDAAKRRFMMLRLVYYPVLVFFYVWMGCMLYLFLHLTGVTNYLKLICDVMLKLCGY